MNTNFILESTNLLSFFNEFRKQNILFNDLLKVINKNKILLDKVLFLLNINNELFYEILKVIKKNYIGNDRPLTYCFEYNLILILHVKNNLNNWSILQSLIICHNPYKSVYGQFRRWSKVGVFLKAFENNINDNISKINLNKTGIIDATSVSNKYGSESVTINPEYKKKNVTKMSVLIIDKIIVGTTHFKTNKKEVTLKNKVLNIKTFEHDSKTIQRTVDNVNKNIILDIIIADGGYKTNLTTLKNNKKIKIITPNRKNQKNKLNTVDDKELLKKRYQVENVLGSIKMNNERIMLRKDRKNISFDSWFNIALLEHNIKILKKRL